MRARLAAESLEEALERCAALAEEMPAYAVLGLARRLVEHLQDRAPLEGAGGIGFDASAHLAVTALRAMDNYLAEAPAAPRRR